MAIKKLPTQQTIDAILLYDQIIDLLADVMFENEDTLAEAFDYVREAVESDSPANKTAALEIISTLHEYHEKEGFFIGDSFQGVGGNG